MRAGCPVVHHPPRPLRRRPGLGRDLLPRLARRAESGSHPRAQYRSPLAKRPYDLRHACVSLQLNAGVPATQVAEWAGHGVQVLLRVFAKCIEGQDEAARRHIEGALDMDDDQGER